MLRVPKPKALQATSSRFAIQRKEVRRLNNQIQEQRTELAYRGVVLDSLWDENYSASLATPSSTNERRPFSMVEGLP